MSNSPFKSQIIVDAALFINDLEFAELHTIGDKTVHAIIDDNELLARQDARSKKMDGMYLGEKLVYVLPFELGYKPKAGKVIMLDGYPYKVSKVSDECGVYGISLEANRA